MENTNTVKPISGGEFLLRETVPQEVFTPEDYNEEQLMLREAIQDFNNKEIEPNIAIFDSEAGTKIAPEKLELLGELGYLGLSVPESFGGFGCDIKTDLAASEIMSDSFSFSQTLGIQRGLGINTILFYGNEMQKNKYLNGIIAGQIKCAYCLTEPSAGSDASSGKTKAVFSEDGKHFILTGQKMWITNAGFADVFSVFCKIESDQKLSCLLVEKEWGVTLGEEEKKLGIHGSSTRQVFFEDIKVPVENLLGERSKGFKIAMNALNMGRLMIGVAGSAIAKRAFNLGLSYSNQRIQFGQRISSFGAIQEKIANMAYRIFALEASWNRLAGDMDNKQETFLSDGIPILKVKQKVAASFAAECAIIKVLGSEFEQFVVDEALQIHGGMGFSAESEISILYKNIRGNRIYEGTNEINKQLIPGTILKLALKGKLPLLEALQQIMPSFEAEELSAAEPNDSIPLYAQAYLIAAKKAILLIAGIAIQKIQVNIKGEQEVMARLADLFSYLYFLESAILRTSKHQEKDDAKIFVSLMQLSLYEFATKFRQASEEILCYCLPPAEAAQKQIQLNKLFQLRTIDLISLKRKIAAFFIQQNSYKLNI